MWLDKLKGVNKRMSINGDLTYLNLNFELHQCLYIMEILKDIVSFKINENKLKIYLNDSYISFDKFYNWWQIQRCIEVNKEENKLIVNYEKVKANFIKLNNELNNIEKEEEKNEINEKIKKLDLFLKKEFPILKNNLQLLTRFRNGYPNKELLKKLIENILFYLKYN